MTTVDRVAAPRTVPPFGAFNATLVRLELRRMLRNRRTVIFSVVMPVVFFLLFGTGKSYSDDSAGHGNVAAFIMVSMALYGAMLSTTGGGAMVAVERSQGWSRQLRLTPLTSTAYIAVKVLVAMLLGGLSVVVTYTAGALTGAHMDTSVWVVTGLAVWVGSLVFAAFGVFMGYLLPSENVMQVLGPGLALFAFLGGLFVPLDQMGSTFRAIAHVTPMYGLNQVVHAPLTGDAPGWAAVVNVAVWLAVFVGGAVWRFGRDTARV
ncbi:ABC transporter permease [Pedococcus ginsenosidimutans]|uniref:ABC transporter permease n=1 Tax=Pedococcus ginsenosidimutans TaxID=490570 RepID=A0ABP8YPE9_9MICO